MKKRSPNTSGLAPLIALLCLWVGTASVLSANDSERPLNFLILVTDDQRWDQLSCADQPIIPELETPNLDRLAEDGVFFRNTFITTPICAVSRASIVTGRYVSTHGMNHFRTPIAPEVLDKSYPALLRRVGYRTGMLGKWGMGKAGTEQHFDVFKAWTRQGSYFHETDAGRIHNSEWLARRTREFLESNPEDQPFCLTVCFKAPHHPYQPDERDAHRFGDVQIPRRATDTSGAYAALPGHIMAPSLNRWCYFDERKDQATREDFEKNFLRCVLSMDRAVGKILESLEALDLEENTVVLFISDHGYLWGEHGLGGKWLLYEESIRVPLIVRLPDLPAAMRGARITPMALNIDIAPTLLDLAGLSVPDVMDGMSLKPALLGRDFTPREHFFMEHVGVVKPRHPIPDSRGVRSEDWKYIRYINAEPEVEALYHLADDPFEQNNLVADPEAAKVLEQMRSQYGSYLEQLAPEQIGRAK